MNDRESVLPLRVFSCQPSSSTSKRGLIKWIHPNQLGGPSSIIVNLIARKEAIIGYVFLICVAFFWQALLAHALLRKARNYSVTPRERLLQLVNVLGLSRLSHFIYNDQDSVLVRVSGASSTA